MTTPKAPSPSSDSARGLLSSLRDVLFEHTPPAAVEVSASQNSTLATSAADIEAARAVLRAALDAQLGPGVREFALQDEALEAWEGKRDNVPAAQHAFYHRAKCDSAAALGRYDETMEMEAA